MGSQAHAMQLASRHDELVDVTVTGARSVPQVFINSTFVGSGNDVERLSRTGEQSLLAKTA